MTYTSIITRPYKAWIKKKKRKKKNNRKVNGQMPEMQSKGAGTASRSRRLSTESIGVQRVNTATVGLSYSGCVNDPSRQAWLVHRAPVGLTAV